LGLSQEKKQSFAPLLNEQMSYEKLITINKLNFKNKKILVIGAGWMAEQYCNALFSMKIMDVTVISRKKESSERCCKKYGYRPLSGGYKNVLPKLNIFDLVIIALPVHKLKLACDFSIKCGNKNILVEKPGALYSNVINVWANKTRNVNVRIRIAHNRCVYPSLWKLKELAMNDGGITSCFYTFTEWVHTINFNNNRSEVYKRWGIANSLHVIGMAHYLMGMPKKTSTYQSGGLAWHPTGSRFTGSGITENNVTFSYHADWDSAGRWGLEIMTTKNAYRLIPLEKLFFCPKNSVNWREIKVTPAYPNAKDGIAEEIAIMLDKKLEKNIPLITLKKAFLLNRLAENIFGYSHNLPKKDDK